MAATVNTDQIYDKDGTSCTFEVHYDDLDNLVTRLRAVNGTTKTARFVFRVSPSLDVVRQDDVLAGQTREQNIPKGAGVRLYETHSYSLHLF